VVFLVGLSQRVESAIAAATVTDRLTDSGCLLAKRSCTGHTSKGFEITVIGLMGDLGSSVKIGYAAAQFAPLFLTFFIAFFGLKIFRVIKEDMLLNRNGAFWSPKRNPADKPLWLRLRRPMESAVKSVSVFSINRQTSAKMAVPGGQPKSAPGGVMYRAAPISHGAPEMRASS